MLYKVLNMSNEVFPGIKSHCKISHSKYLNFEVGLDTGKESINVFWVNELHISNIYWFHGINRSFGRVSLDIIYRKNIQGIYILKQYVCLV